MTMFIIFLGVIGSGAILTGLVRLYATKHGVVDTPNSRSSHLYPTPRGGGLSIVVLLLGAVIALWVVGDLEGKLAIAILGGGGLIAVVGFVDDHSPVPAVYRFILQIIAATFALTILGGLPEIQVGNAVVDLGLAGDLMGLLFMVWFTNAFNFMDGIDGIAASEAICIAVGALIIMSMNSGGLDSLLLAVLIAASLGFLVWNWPPAKIFMGDVGSAFLGYILIVIAFMTSGEDLISIWSWLILAGVFIVDATVTLLTRIVRRENWLSAHRSHAYQIVSRRYDSHSLVTIGVIALNVLWLFPIAFLAAMNREYGWWLTIAGWSPLIALSLWYGAGRRND